VTASPLLPSVRRSTTVHERKRGEPILKSGDSFLFAGGYSHLKKILGAAGPFRAFKTDREGIETVRLNSAYHNHGCPDRIFIPHHRSDWDQRQFRFSQDCERELRPRPVVPDYRVFGRRCTRRRAVGSAPTRRARSESVNAAVGAVRVRRRCSSWIGPPDWLALGCGPGGLRGLKDRFTGDVPCSFRR
jgi:hypothetical protein